MTRFKTGCPWLFPMAFSFLDPILGPLLSLPPVWGILLISGILSLLLTLAYKFTTNQTLMKQLKDEIAVLQKELKELRSDPEKALHVQKKAMEANMKYMMESLKPTLVTFIPIILIFGWLSGHYSVEPLPPGTQFSVDAHFSTPEESGIRITAPPELELRSDRYATIGAGKGEWFLNATAQGRYTLLFDYANKTYTKLVLITTQRSYEDPELTVNEHGLSDITVNHLPLTVLNLFGWKLGWLGAYIIFSILFSLIFRKALKVY